MPKFDLKKGSKFVLDKGIQNVRVGLGWDADDTTGKGFDLDASAFGLVHLTGGKPVFYNDGSHAVFYANHPLKQPDGKFVTADGSITHTGDNRTGAGSGDDEVIYIDFSKLPKDIVEIAIWVTIYEAVKNNQNFGLVKNSYIKVTDAGTNADLCEYKLRDEFGAALSVQVGGFTKDENDIWSFTAVGAGAAVELGAILDQYN